MPEITAEELRLLKFKADKYDELEEIVGSFYDDDTNESDLGDIGERVAIFFGFL